MKHSSFELTPQQKGMLASLLSETGESAPAVLAAIAKALEEFQEEAAASMPGNGYVTAAPPESSKPIWQIFEEASRRIPDEELDRLPPDLAAQVDHYIYGTPKR